MPRQPLRRASQVLDVEFVEPRDLACITAMSVDFVYKCIAAGTLRSLKFGSRVRIQQADAVEWLASLGVSIPTAPTRTLRPTG